MIGSTLWASHELCFERVCASLQASIIVFLLALVIGTGATLTAVFGGRFAVQDLIHHRNIGFSSLCAAFSSG